MNPPAQIEFCGLPVRLRASRRSPQRAHLDVRRSKTWARQVAFMVALVWSVWPGLAASPFQRVPPESAASLAAKHDTKRKLKALPWPGQAASPRPDLFVWTDTCNVYVVRVGDSAVLIDLGDGSVLDHLDSVGVKHVDWVLFTHHHREQCQGAWRLKTLGIQAAGPEKERALFERPTEFRNMNVRLGDAFTIHGSSFVRPPVEPVPLARTFGTNDVFHWRECEFRCVETAGNSPGGMSYSLDAGASVAFTGDVMLADARMHTWFDTEWDYGFAAGIQALRKSVARLAQGNPLLLLPSHGPPVHHPSKQLDVFSRKLQQLEKLYVRGYGVEQASVAYQDKVSRPTAISNVWQVTPHLFKFKKPNFWPNFGLILADSGHALVVDCGLLDETFLDASLQSLRQHYGLKAIDGIIITHMHGDHFLEAPHLRERWGAPIWGLDRMAAVCEHPEWFDYAAPIQAYGKNGVANLRFDRLLQPGEKFDWEGHHFTVDWMPGQTEFALCLHGEIDGRHVAFTGDNIFGDPDDPSQTGHEAVVAHNSAILEEGYIRGAEYLKRIQPDLLVGGHSFVMDHPARFIERFRKWSYEMRAAFQGLSSEKDYRYWFDPFWVRAEPYRVPLSLGGSSATVLRLRNFSDRPLLYRVSCRAPDELVVEPNQVTTSISPRSVKNVPLSIRAGPALRPGVHLVGLDVSVAGKRRGELFDFVVGVEEPPPAASSK